MKPINPLLTRRRTWVFLDQFLHADCAYVSGKRLRGAFINKRPMRSFVNMKRSQKSRKKLVFDSANRKK